jgi:MoCo/4Fe-4S cofactor protein with predicted Tat translocation signal
MTAAPLDLAALRARLASQPGRPFWRSLEEAADTAEFRAWLTAEFPAAVLPAPAPDRRRFLQLMAASLAMSGLAACGRGNSGHIVPYVHEPQHLLPGVPLTYASSALLDGFANGVQVTTVNGRPIKIEGNEQHPWSRGGTDVFAQASVLQFYDPDRSQTVRNLGRISNWESFAGVMTGRIAALRAEHGRGLRLLTGPVTSPSLGAQIEALRTDFPEMHWHVHETVPRAAVREAATAAFGRPLEAQAQFDRARVVVALDGDFLDHGPQQVGMARRWSDARRAAFASGRLLELHAAAPTPTLVSAKADYSVVAPARGMAALAEALLADVTAATPPAPAGDPLSQWRARAAAALRSARGAGVVLVGASQPAPVHAAVHRLNAALGNTGATVFYTIPAAAPAEPLSSLVAAMQAGEVAALVMLDTNPAYTAPGDLGFIPALARVKLKIHAGLAIDETANHADWHLPLSHPLESWGDARAFDGTISMIQPTIAPLYDTRSAAEVLATLTEAVPRGGLAIMQDFWRHGRSEAAFLAGWQASLRDGFIPGSAFPPETVRTPPPSTSTPATTDPGAIDLLIRPDPSVWDGAFANVGWMQELPKPLTKITWDNLVAVSPRLAERLHLANGEIVEITVGAQQRHGPVWIMPGQADDAITVTLGYGRGSAGSVADGVGFDAYALRRAASPWQAAGVRLRRTGGRTALATTQDHATMEGHDFVRVQQVGGPPAGDKTAFTQPTLYPPKATDGRSWGMVIDTDACIGCNACVTACQAENNIAVVGREEVLDGRWMHWLRIDRYYEGPLDAPQTHFMPVPCMMCEQAPCEVACPVEATLHDAEGLNLMVYNRCVGTRACSGYCPYKVRRFNFHNYTSGAAPSLQAQRNPEVTVRASGVMEKCTYCVQRIAVARIAADKENRPIRDGEVQTACQGACPTRAITFGDLLDPASKVAHAHADPRNYALLGELNTRPHTTYLASLAPAKSKAEG